MNTTAVITGATKGIGKAIAFKFLQEGCDIAICARTQSDLNQIQNEWQQLFPRQKIIVFAADFANANDVKTFADAVLQAFSTVDILVNNAGIFLPGNVIDEVDNLQEMMNVNLMSVYHLTRKLLPVFITKKSGHIFNISSVAGLQPYKNGSGYSISKYALQGFSDNLREELKPYGVKVTAVCPGPTMSHSWAESGVDESKIMEAQDIAEVVWAASRLSPQACVERIVLNPQDDL